MYKRILVPLDGSETARLGLREAMALAREQKATLRLLHVVSELPPLMETSSLKDYGAMRDSLFEHGEQMLSEAKSLAATLAVEAEIRLRDTQGGRVADAIVAEAQESGCDLIVIGTHGRRGVSRVLLGSDAERVLRQSMVPVLLVRETHEEAA
jgi:nucleotide-binding universal stress UspA family protein